VPWVYDVALSPAYATDHTLLAAVQGGGLYRSADGGATWALVNDSSPPTFQGLAFSPAFATDQTVFYRGLSGTVLMSRDGGDGWVTLPTSGLSAAAASSVFTMAISPDFAADGRVFVGTQNDGVWSVDSRLPIPQQSDPVTVSILVGNPPPVAAADAAATPEDTPVTIPVLANDTDPNGQPMTAVVFAQPGNGSVAANGAGALVFTPSPNFAGTATFTYRAFDGSGYSAVTTVTVTVTAVNDLPVPEYTFSEYAYEDTPREYVRPAGYVLGYDADGDALTVVLETGVQHGTLVLQPDGSFTYTPDANYSGPDGFTVRVSDGTALSADVGTITLTVYAVNDAPVAGADAFETDEEVPVSGNLFDNDADPVEGDPLLYWSVYDYPQFGNAIPGPGGTFTYYPYPDFFGTDTFTYVVYDDYSGTHSNPATVTVTVHGTPDAPVAAGEGYAVVAGGTLVVAAADGVVANDTDVDQEPLSAVLAVGPAHGTLTLNADGSFAYTPDAGFFGTDSFTYRAVDGGLLESEPVTVEIVVGTQAVTTLLDVVDAGDGVVSLREAIDAANLNPGPDRIGFNVRRFIDVLGPLPALSDANGGTTIVGYVPAGLAPAVGVRGNGGSDGLVLTSAGNEVRGLFIGSFETAIRITGPDATGNVIAGNSIGVIYDPVNGWLDLSNTGVGILIEDAPGNRIGSGGVDGPAGRNLLGYNQAGAILVTGAGATGNVIAGNDVGGRRRTADWDYDGFGNPGVGITVQAPGTVVGGAGADEDNFVAGSNTGVWVQGPNAAGTVVVGNVVVDNFNDGVDIEVVAGVVVSGNVVGGSGNWGVFVYGPDAAGTQLLGNFIGTDATGAMDWGNQNDGVYVLDAPGTVIAGNHIGANYGNGVRVEGLAAAGTVIEGNVIGVAFDPVYGEVSLRNWAGGGVVTNAPNTLVAGNLISGNEDGYAVYIEGSDATGAVVHGNTIGTNSTGETPLPNYEGITAYGAPGLLIEDNLISGNHTTAVNVGGPGGPTVTIRGNLIGVDQSGNGAIGNGDWGSDGSVVLTGELDVVLGGTGPGEGNVISGDISGYGVYISTTGAVLVAGNHIGVGTDTSIGIGNASAGLALDVAVAASVEVTGNVISHNGGPGVAIFGGFTPATPVVIRSNRMYINEGPSIDLGYDGATYNDYDPDNLPPDQDAGPNGFQNYPDLAAATGTFTSVTVAGVLHSTPETTFAVEFYAAGQDFGYAYAERLLGTVELTTDADGTAAFTLTLAVPVADGEWVSAIATGTEGTSEVAPAVKIQFDYDTDGVGSAVEDAGPNGGDGNSDGTPDSQQVNVASLPNAVDARYLTLAAPADTGLAGTTSGSPPADLPAGVNLPFGTLDFAVAGLAPGAATEVTIYLPAGVVVDAYYKFGPEAGNATPHWYAFTFDGTTGAELLGDRIVLHFIDGGRGDDDGTADGRVTDPGAPVQFLSAHTVTVRGSVLSDPAASQFLQLENADLNTDLTGGYFGDRTFALTPAVYRVTLPNGPGGPKLYGTFTVASDLSLVNATGALVISGDEVAFDLTLLTAVTLDPTGLSVGGLFQYVQLNSVAYGATQPMTFHLPDGDYSVSTPNGPFGPKDYGWFTVAGGLGGLTDALTLTAADTIGFDTAQLAAVTIDPRGLSEPFGQQYATLNSVGDGTTEARTFHLPAGTYRVATPNGPGGDKEFGTFTVAADLSITDVTGALLVSSAGLVTFDLTQLAAIAFDPSVLGSVAGLQFAEINSLAFGTAGPVTYHVPAGTYRVSTGNGPFGDKEYGTFTVTPELTLTGFTGAVVAGAGGIDFALCDLNRLRVTPQPGVSWQFSGASNGYDTTADVSLPDGTYRFDVFTTGGEMTSFDVVVGGGAASPAAVTGVTFTPLGCLYGVSIDTDGYVGRYSIDGGPDRYGAAALDLSPGPHTLELWGLVVPFHVDGAGRIVSDAPAAATVVGHTLRLNTVIVTVDRNGYGGYLDLFNLPPAGGADPEYVLVRGLTGYSLSVGGNANFHFDLDAAGDVTSQNAVAAVGIGSHLRLNTTTVTIERNGYDGYLSNSSYQSGLGSGDQAFALVPGLTGYVIGFGGNATISIDLDAAGNVTSQNAAAATGIGSALRLYSVTVTVDPAGYTSYYALTSTHPFAATSYRLVRNVANYQFGFAENALASFGVNADGTVTSQSPGALVADGSTLRFRTTAIRFDPGSYAGQYSLGVTTQLGVSGVWDVVLVSGVSDYHLDGPDGFLAHFALDAAGEPVPTVLNVVINGNSVTFTLSAVTNRPPVAADDTATTAEDTPTTIAVLANDTDPDGDPLTVTAVTQPAHGSAALNADGTVTYTPAANYAGTDTFTYTASDGRGGTATATVTLTVTAANDVPTAAPHAYTVAEDGLLVVPAGAGLLAGATDPDGDSLVVAAVNGSAAAVGVAVPTAQGTVTVSADGSFTYVPAPMCDATTDSFTFTVSDGHGGTATATVTIALTQYTGVTLVGGILRVAGTADNDVVTIQGGNLKLNGTAYSLAGVVAVRVWGRAGNDSINLGGLSVVTLVAGGPGNDDLTGGSGSDTLRGGCGDDELRAVSGNDTLSGGDGNDTLRAGSGSDALDGGVGDDQLYGASGGDVLRGGAGNDVLRAGSSADALFGDDGNDTLLGGSGSDTLDGGAGNDQIDGGSGADVVVGGPGNDYLLGGTGDDYLDAGDGDDQMDGGAGNDVLVGAAGNDLLVGGSGNDVLVGGAGSDTIVGNAGDDVMIGGVTVWDANPLALFAVRDVWAGGGSYQARVAALQSATFAYRLVAGQTVLDDGAVDQLTGSSGSDLFFANATGGGAQDAVTDLGGQEELWELDPIVVP